MSREGEYGYAEILEVRQGGKEWWQAGRKWWIKLSWEGEDEEGEARWPEAEWVEYSLQPKELKEAARARSNRCKQVTHCRTKLIA